MNSLIATLALCVVIASGFAIVRAGAGERFPWPASLSKMFGHRAEATLSPPVPLFAANLPVSENFDGIGTTATATLPTDFKVDKNDSTVRSVGTFTAAGTATERVDGASVGAAAANGIYNFGSGTTDTGTDRAIGFISSGTATKSGNLYVELANNSGSNYSGLKISYDVEKYRNGSNSAGYSIQMYYSTDGSTWTSAGANFLTSFGGDIDNSGFSPAPGTTTSITNQILSQAINNGSNFYLAWNYSVTSGAITTNAQALGIDNIVISGTKTISGTLFDSAGLPITTGKTINLLQNGTSVGTTTTNVSGDYSFSGLTLTSGDRIAVFVDNAAEKGAAVTLSAAANISALNIFQNRLVVRSDNGIAITNANLSNAQGGAPDADLTAIYTMSGSDLTTSAGVSLQIWSGSTYQPGGNITDGGDWTNNGTFTAGSNTVTFNGTANQSIGGNNNSFFSTLTISPSNSAIVSLAVNTNVSTALNVNLGVFSQGESGVNDFSLTTNAVSVAPGATWRNLGKGDLQLTGDVGNAGTINFNANGAACEEVATNDIQITSSGAARTWSGAGTFSMTDVDVKDQTAAGIPTLPAVIIVNSGTDSGGNTRWTFTSTCAGPYTWIGGANQDWTVSTNWSPVRLTAATLLPATTTDQLIFDGNVTPTPTITNVPNQQIATLKLVNNNVAVTLKSSGANTLRLSGVTGNDLSIAAGTALTLAGTNALTLELPAGSAANVDGPTPGIRGSIALLEAAHRVTGADANSLTFKSGAIFTAGSSVTTGFNGNPFGAGTNGSVVFESGANAFFNEGSDPFGGSGKSVTTFNSGSTARFGAASAFSTSDARSYGNLILAGNQVYAPSGSGETTVNGNFTLGNPLTLTDTSTLQLSGNLNLLGDFADRSSNGSAFDPNGRTVLFQGGSTTQTISKTSGTESFFDVFIAESAGGKVQLLTAVTINGQLNLSTADSVLELNAQTLTLNGAVTGSGKLKGDLGGAHLSVGGVTGGDLGTLNFLSGAETLSTLTVNRTGASSSVTLGNNLTVGGTTNLTNGVVNMGAFTLSVNGVTRTSGWINGNEQRSFFCTDPCSVTFDVGTANGYSPISEVFHPNANTTYSQTIKAIEGPHPSILSANALQRYWEVGTPSPAIGSADITFKYRGGAPTAGDVVGNEADYKIFRYSGSFEQFEPSVAIDTVNHTATLNGVSSFSDWTLAEPAEPPEIAVEESGNDLTSGGPPIDFGNESIGVPGSPVTFTIYNSGPGPLAITSVTSNNSDFSVDTSGMSSPVASGDSTTFTVTFTPSIAGPRSGTIQINNNDADENPFDIRVVGNRTCPSELVVNTTEDGEDFNSGDGICETAAGNGTCTLRAAIEEGNALNDNCGPILIKFNIPDNDLKHVYYKDDAIANHVTNDVAHIGVTALSVANDSSIGDIDPDYQHSWWRIQSEGGMPSIKVALDMDGYFQSGASRNTKHLNEGDDAILRIEIDGSQTAFGTNGLEFFETPGDYSIITGLVINHFDQAHDIYVGDEGGHIFAGNFLGVDVSGTLGDGTDGTGIYLNSGWDTLVGGEFPEDRNVLSGHGGEGGAGIWINTSFTTVEGNYIGTDRNGAVAIPNTYGVIITDGSLNTIGCDTLDGDNVISGNDNIGVSIGGGFGNLVQGNFIGTDKCGKVPLPNKTGIALFNSYQNFIGFGFGNVISGNLEDGVVLKGSSSDNVVQTNLIGVDVDGTLPLGNGGNGVEVYTGSTGNIIGEFGDSGTFRAQLDSRSQSLGNKGSSGANKASDGANQASSAIRKSSNPKAARAQVRARKQSLRNRGPRRTIGELFGQRIEKARIEAAKKQSLRNKDSSAVNISPEACGCPTGANTIANNGEDGVKVSSNGDINNRISQNSIYANVGLGINLVDNDPVTEGPSTVTPNDDGDNDGDIGPNGLQNFPVILSASATTGVIQFSLDTCDDGPYTIEFFSNASGCDIPSGYGEGQTHLGSYDEVDGSGTYNSDPLSFNAGDIITTTATDTNGNTSEFSACFVVPAAPATPNVSVTVSPLSVVEDGGTNLVYQFSRTDTTDPLTVNFQVFGSATFNTDYTQTGAATFSSTAGTVNFGAGAATVDVTIDPTVDATPETDEDVILKVVSGSGYNVVNPDIATGTIQDDDCPSSLLVNSNGDNVDFSPGDGHCDIDSNLGNGDQCTLRAAIQEVNALNACANFIEINFNIPGGGVHTITPGSPLPSIQHPVTINGYSQPGAIENTSTGANNAVLLIELTGLSAGSGADGLVLQAGGIVIKGLVINRFGGVAITIPDSSFGNEVIGNFIGTDATGMLAGDGNGPFGNDVGVLILNGAVNQIGCTFAEERNIISGNLEDGVQITGESAFLNFVQGNFIGVGRDGVSALGNGGVGIEIYEGGVSTLIGGETNPPPSQDPGTPAPARNIIAFNGEEGVLITAAPDVSNQIMQNSIYSNGLLGINLVKPAEPGPADPANGVTANDTGDGDNGPNNLQNFPVITSADVATQTINASLNSTPNRFFYTIEFFRSPSCDPSGYGEGKTYIGSVSNVNTDSNGDVSFSLGSPLSPFGPGEAITATATDSVGNTSEFSQCFSIPLPTVTVAVASPTPSKVVPEDGPTNLVFRFTRSDTAGALTVNFDVSGTATFGTDYTQTGAPTFTAATGTATFTNGNSTVDVTIDPTPDIKPEANETVTLTLTPGAGYAVGTPATDTGTIQDDDPCPTVFTVNSASDTLAGDATPGDGICATSGGACTLRAAVEEANALINCGTIEINFAIGSQTITLTAGQLSVEHNVNIVGPTTNSVVVNGNGASRVFSIGSDNTVSISNLTITGGNAAAGNGGGILNPGILILNGVTVSGNSAVDGGGIWSTTNNSLTLINTTISGNSASGNGGGLYNGNGQAALTNVTIAYNTANSGLGSAAGGGIFVASGDVLLHNTIVADNLKALSVSTTTPDDISGPVLASSSYNLIGTGNGGLTNGGANHNQVGVASALLGALKNHGGPTSTHPLVYNSPAVDAGDDCVVTGCGGNSPVVNKDQRAKSRQPLTDGDNNGSSAVDIGAYERQLTEIRDVPFSSLATVDIVDARVTLPCAGVLCEGGDRAKRDTAIAPAFDAPVVTLTNIDPSPLNSLTRPPNLVIGNSSSPALPAFEVTTSASYQPPVTICFYLPSITDAGFFAGLKVLHREAGNNTNYGDSDDVLVEPMNPTNDFANKLLCGQVNSFSAFAIAHTAPTPTAANGSVSGQILDTNGQPVEGAAVRMSGTQNRLTVTDARGNYHFDDVETNGLYVVTPSRLNFTFSPAQRSFSQLGSNTEAIFTGAANGGTLNPLDATEYFVRQQYVDFLGREPDEAGFNFWVRNIDSCGVNDFGCREAKRIDTSAAFFLSIEFQQTGYLVYRTYQAAFGDISGAPVPLKLSEFKPDTLQISNRVVVLQDGWQQRLESNKKAFMEEFVQRRRFVDAYPVRMSPVEFVDKLFANAGVPSTDTDYAAAIEEFGRATDTSDAAARARALRRIAENSFLARRRFNQAFVLMEYFGYLNRDPNSGQDRDFSGYNFWLDKLNRFDGNFREAEMVKAFLSSIEYLGRFPR